MIEKFDRIDRKLAHKGHIIDMYEDTIKVPNGNVVKWDFIGHKGAAAVVPVRDDGKILMVRQYRNALDRETLEIPAGGLDSTEEPFVICSHRELEEETGYICAMEELEYLITVRTTVAFCNERIDVFVARNLKKTEQRLDEDEFINVEAYSVEELCQMIYQGKIEDGKTIASIMSYKSKYLS